MRILHILATPRAEGTPNLVLDWLELPGCRQEVFALHCTPADLTDQLREKAAWYGEGELLIGRGALKFLRIIREVRRLCRERRPDLVICWHTGFAGWVAAGVRLALGSRARFIAHCGNPPNRGKRADWISRMVLVPVWLAGGKCACCSYYVRDLYRQIPALSGGMFTAIYNCARVSMIQRRAQASRDAKRMRGSDEEIYGVTVATLEGHKDHVTLLRALPSVIAACPNFSLWLVGDGSLRSELESLARQLGVEAVVRFLGASREVPEWLGRADLFLFSTTLQEGFGSVLLEALSAGLPIVATDCPACREVLADGRYGSLVPAGDPVAFSGQILHCINNLATHDPSPGVAYASGFTPERMLREYLQLAGLPIAGTEPS